MRGKEHHSIGCNTRVLSRRGWIRGFARTLGRVIKYDDVDTCMDNEATERIHQRHMPAAAMLSEGESILLKLEGCSEFEGPPGVPVPLSDPQLQTPAQFILAHDTIRNQTEIRTDVDLPPR